MMEQMHLVYNVWVFRLACLQTVVFSVVVRHPRCVFINYNRINQLPNTTIWWLDICCLLHRYRGIAVAQWLRCCATIRKVAGSIPAGVSGFFIDIKSFRSYYGPGVDSASNRNEYQEYFLGVKAAGA